MVGTCLVLWILYMLLYLIHVSRKQVKCMNWQTTCHSLGLACKVDKSLQRWVMAEIWLVSERRQPATARKKPPQPQPRHSAVTLASIYLMLWERLEFFSIFTLCFCCLDSWQQKMIILKCRSQPVRPPLASLFHSQPSITLACAMCGSRNLVSHLPTK